MTVCQIEERMKGGAYPRTCPTCGVFGPCKKGLKIETGPLDHVQNLQDEPVRISTTEEDRQRRHNEALVQHRLENEQFMRGKALECAVRSYTSYQPQEVIIMTAKVFYNYIKEGK